MMEQITISDKLLFICSLFWLSTMVAWLCFSRISMRRFEKQFKVLGVERIDWDGPGFRVLSYATVVLFKTDRLNDNNYQFVPVSETRKLATKKDWYLALWLWGSGIGMLVVGFTYAFFFMV